MRLIQGHAAHIREWTYIGGSASYRRYRRVNEPMNDQPFHPGELDAQRRWGTAGIWDQARQKRLLWDHIPSEFHARLEEAAFFFLATSTPDGRCDCSFKGGGPGLMSSLFAAAERGGARVLYEKIGRASCRERVVIEE